MILNTAPQNQAVLSNVGEIGGFKIKASAKAFSILSSGLYANKIRAVVRELSCNAYDSHVAAGKRDTPFDVHLPNTLGPHFSIRDYGTGLSHEQVTNIYTTYFESTKTASNEFIGALGLGSKSPFSYTDNFTVTAIQDGWKGIYTAFINEAGVPSIALMLSEETDEPAGVEVKFSVNDYYDFDKFRKEARVVYKHFALRPIVVGGGDFLFENNEYETQDIIPGVHSIKNGRQSIAIMGNIAYPIDIPSADTSISDVMRALLRCGLEMHFGIGELDFQASREGLSYIPSTVAAIKAKLEQVTAALTVVLAKEADAIPNLWDRAMFLRQKRTHTLWVASVVKYATDVGLPTYDVKDYHQFKNFTFKVDDLSTNWNIKIRSLRHSHSAKAIVSGKSSTGYDTSLAVGAKGQTWQEWHISVDDTSHFIINDSKSGAGERVRYHYRETGCNVHSRTIWILEKADKNKTMDTAAFFAAIHEPPTTRRFAASTLKQRVRENMGKNVTILKLEMRGRRYPARQSDNDYVWRDAGDTSKFSSTENYYYVPLSGFVMESDKGYSSGKELREDVNSFPGLHDGEIYGVRKKDIADIKLKPNWKNFEEHIAEQLNTRDTTKILMSLVRSGLDNAVVLAFNNNEVIPYIARKDSPYSKFVESFTGVALFTGDRFSIKRLFSRFAPNKISEFVALKSKFENELLEVNKRYPLLVELNSYRINVKSLRDYVNMCDDWYSAQKDE